MLKGTAGVISPSKFPDLTQEETEVQEAACRGHMELVANSKRPPAGPETMLSFTRLVSTCSIWFEICFQMAHTQMTDILQSEGLLLSECEGGGEKGH